MSGPYLCPNCTTNRTRFNMIEQIPKAIKMDPESGEVVQEYTNDNLDAFHIPYKGSHYRVQCGACGLIENEETFKARASSSKNPFLS
ncbi:DNA alkylation repair protein [Pseudalkalibacillus decolorationis]|uniref:DNA alkylation repair protein n=1 Tax=Pseudalkalibacillus decolorationis TaxID=163879 RepID=UPI002148E402|nr:DNA alkylation repair protein [Pseudalkalibacillus decolorationis]